MKTLSRNSAGLPVKISAENSIYVNSVIIYHLYVQWMCIMHNGRIAFIIEQGLTVANNHLTSSRGLKYETMWVCIVTIIITEYL